MKKIITFLLTASLTLSQVSALALHETTKTVNDKYAGYIEEAIEKSQYKDNIDKDNIYIIEKYNFPISKGERELYEFHVAIPIMGTDDIAYSIFREGKYDKEVFNSGAVLYVENHLTTQIDKYIEDNQLQNVTEVINTLFYARVRVDSYRVIADNETYFIPYRFNSEYNLANDETCNLELGKAYKSDEFISILEKEQLSYTEYQEALKKADEEKKEAEKKAEEEKYTPIFSLDENGDEVITVNGYNLDDVLSELISNIELMGSTSLIDIGVETDTQNYIAKHRPQEDYSTYDIIEFAKGLFDEIKTQAETGKPASTESTVYCRFNLKHDEGYKSIKHMVTVYVSEDGVKISVNEDEIELKVRNSEAIIEYIDKCSNKGFSGFKNHKNDEDTPTYRGTLDGLTKTDIIDFSFIMPEDNEGTLNTEVASPGEAVKGTFEKYKENKYKSTYILTLSGSNGVVALYNQSQSSLEDTDKYFSNNIPVLFYDNLRFEDEQLTKYEVGKTQKAYSFKMLFKDNDIQEVYFEDTECDDLKYTQLTEDTKLPVEYSEKSKEAVIKSAQECADSLYSLGLFKGTDTGYSLEKSLTREESTAMLVRLLGEEENIDAQSFSEVFTDVPKNRWSFAYVMYCYENDITKGTSTDTFSPYVPINAEQFITLFMRLLGYTDVNPETAYEESIKYSLISSDMVDELKSSDEFLRSQMVQIVYSGLSTVMSNGETLTEFLISKDVITQNQTDEIFSYTENEETINVE